MDNTGKDETITGRKGCGSFGLRHHVIQEVRLSKRKTVILDDDIYVMNKWDQIPKARTRTSVCSITQTELIMNGKPHNTFPHCIK